MKAAGLQSLLLTLPALLHKRQATHRGAWLGAMTQLGYRGQSTHFLRDTQYTANCSTADCPTPMSRIISSTSGRWLWSRSSILKNTRPTAFKIWRLMGRYPVQLCLPLLPLLWRQPELLGCFSRRLCPKKGPRAELSTAAGTLLREKGADGGSQVRDPLGEVLGTKALPGFPWKVKEPAEAE